MEIVGLGTRRVLLIVIADTGRVEQRTVDSPIDVTDEALLDLRSRLNAAVVVGPSTTSRKRCRPFRNRRRRSTGRWQQVCWPACWKPWSNVRRTGS